MYAGKALQLSVNSQGVAEICFDLQGASVNKLNALTRNELKEVIRLIDQQVAQAKVKGVLVTSAKPFFIVGADILEFSAGFAQPETEFVAGMLDINNNIFNAFEDLAVPTVVCLNGMALGGGLELAMAADYRVMSKQCKIGLPETSLGILPGYGGTVRLPRLIGVELAIEWITKAQHYNAEAASRAGLVDMVVEADELLQAALNIIEQCLAGRLDFRAKRQDKLAPVKFDDNDPSVLFAAAKNKVTKQIGPHYPAPLMAIDLLEQGASLTRDAAIALEAAANGRLSKTLVAKNLTGIFIGDQVLTKTAKQRAKTAQSVTKSAVLGAGIMGGGIAYQTALKGLPIIMKDIDQAGIDLGLAEVEGLLSKRVRRGQMTVEQKTQTLARIEPTLDFAGFDGVDIVVEAVVENSKVKQAVLAEAESLLSDSAVLTSNTSTISINQLATGLKRPENFCGMHFFNPVPVMPLVEVIRGEKTSDQTVGRVCSYALALGKKPVVVNDCPGFLINRILTPYFNAFLTLLKHGVEHARIDQIMEQFGWPMGPAYLIDVIGIDTLKHGAVVLAKGYPDRMALGFTCYDVLIEAGRLGQKNGLGFYQYEKDERGRLNKSADPLANELLARHVTNPIDVTDEEIASLMMLSMCLEAVRCLEEDIVATAVELDMSLIYAIGFPQFRGGALRYLEAVGFDAAIKMAQRYQHLGGLYAVPQLLHKKAAQGETFYD